MRLTARNAESLLAAALLSAGWLSACGSSPTQASQIGFDVEPFKSMARAATCARLVNKLYAIDQSLVLHATGDDRCLDGGDSVRLFGTTLADVKCEAGMTIAGPRKGCSAPAYSAMFDTILTHLNDPDLGLGAGRVVPVAF